MSIDYSSRQVWETRFTKYPEQFEWLASADDLLPHIASALDLPVNSGDKDRDNSKIKLTRGRILHIGCGTSKLAFALRDALDIRPQDIVNLDYSQRAIDLGRAQEQEQEDSQLQAQSQSQPQPRMHWVCADLLDWQSLSTPSQSSYSSPPNSPSQSPDLPASTSTSTTSLAPFTLILDKSTSDALACGLDHTVALPFLPGRPHVELEPLALLALHLAALAPPGARWLAMSYSTTRFDFLADALPLDTPIPGVDTAGALWVVERVDEKEAFQQQQPTGGSSHVHRPPIVNHIYTLRRTETPLEVWPASEF